MSRALGFLMFAGVIVFGTISFFSWSFVAGALFDLALLCAFGFLLDGTRPPRPPS